MSQQPKTSRCCAVNVFVGTSDTISELPTKIKPIGRALSVGGSVKLLRGVGTSDPISELPTKLNPQAEDLLSP